MDCSYTGSNLICRCKTLDPCIHEDTGDCRFGCADVTSTASRNDVYGSRSGYDLCIPVGGKSNGSILVISQPSGCDLWNCDRYCFAYDRYHGVLAAQAVSDFLTALMAAILLKHELWSELTDIKRNEKQYRSSIIKRKYRCRKEDMDHVIRKSKEISGRKRLCRSRD